MYKEAFACLEEAGGGGGEWRGEGCGEGRDEKKKQNPYDERVSRDPSFVSCCWHSQAPWRTPRFSPKSCWFWRL